jgi:hypothetical protein
MCIWYTPIKTKFRPDNREFEKKTPQEQFIFLEKKFGIKNKKPISNKQNPEKNQTEIDIVRFELNQLFLNDLVVVDEINSRINDLKNLHPTGWPQAHDYEDLLLHAPKEKQNNNVELKDTDQ